MTEKEVLNKYNISNATLKNWKKLNYIKDLKNIDEKEIEEIIKNKTGIRRNKRISNDYIIPVSYVEDKRIIDIINQIIYLKDKYSLTPNEILHETIIKILNQHSLKIPNELLKILGKRSLNMNFQNDFNKIDINYDEDNDFLGCLYMSLISVGEKDTNGIYYTPFKVVNKIVKSFDFNTNYKIVDPGCGSGNFLIQTYKCMKSKGIKTSTIIRNLYGFDVDDLAVLLAKINIYILDSCIPFSSINIYKKDFLNNDTKIKFDIIIGNPPWGKKYTQEEKKALQKKYDLSFSKMDSFSQFIIKSFSILNDNGYLGFVLPSSVLNIAVHEQIRKFLLANTIEYIKTIGREFGEIVTDVIIIKVKKSAPENNICNYNNTPVKQVLFSNNAYCSFLITDNISECIIDKIKKYSSYHLTDNVNYALGIVTGNNKKYVSDKKIDGSEPIISGKELNKYKFDYSKIKKYIVFDTNNFQQVAKEDFYRWKNKIIYKFIGKKLCFAVESNGFLTLNSANVICLGSDYDPYYTSAILNSRITQLYFEDVYDTHKVLKNHIQSFYIPNFNNEIKNHISSIIKNYDSTNDYCEEIEKIIYSELCLTDKEIEYLKNRF